jgi:hypothetical protein
VLEGGLDQDGVAEVGTRLAEEVRVHEFVLNVIPVAVGCRTILCRG